MIPLETPWTCAAAFLFATFTLQKPVRGNNGNGSNNKQRALAEFMQFLQVPCTQ